MGGVGEGGFEGADGELAGFGRRGFVGGDGAEGAEEVEVRLFFLGGFFGDFGDGEVEFALVFFVGFPLGDPCVEVLELGAEKFEGTAGADYAEDGEEDVVADIIVLGEDVKDCGEDGESETRAVGWRGGDWTGEVLTYSREEHVGVGGLANEVD